LSLNLLFKCGTGGVPPGCSWHLRWYLDHPCEGQPVSARANREILACAPTDSKRILAFFSRPMEMNQWLVTRLKEGRKLTITFDSTDDSAARRDLIYVLTSAWKWKRLEGMKEQTKAWSQIGLRPKGERFQEPEYVTWYVRHIACWKNSLRANVRFYDTTLETKSCPSVKNVRTDSRQ
jgi:hypothetical protein